MRGNEVELRSATATAAAITIPMRGNEIRRFCEIMADTIGDYDPHEG